MSVAVNLFKTVSINREWKDRIIYTISLTLRCVIPVVCVTNEREENVVKQHN